MYYQKYIYLKFVRRLILLIIMFNQGGQYAFSKNDLDQNSINIEKEDAIREKSLQNVTVNAKKRDFSISGSPLQTLNEEILSNISSPSLSDAVKRFSGAMVKDYGGIGGLKTINIRSMGSEHTGVSYDGVSISNCQSGQIDLSNFSLNNVSELSLSIGQNEDIFQPAKIHASAATLFIKTKKNDLTSDKPVFINAFFRGGSYELINPAIMFSQRISESLSYSLYVDYIKSDGEYPFKYKNGNKTIDAKRINSDIESLKSELNIYKNIGKHQSLNTKVYALYSDRGLPGGVIYDNTFSAERLKDKNYFLHLNYENEFSSKIKFKSSLKGNYSWNKHTDIHTHGFTDNQYTQYEGYATASLLYTPLKSLSFSLSQDYIYNYLKSNIENFVSPERNSSLTSVSAKYSDKYITATATLLNTYIIEESNRYTSADNKKKLSPSFSISYRPFSFTNFRIRTSYKEIFRIPTFNDMYYRVVGNSSLRPETSKQFNSGISWIVTPGRIMQYINISADIYYNIIDDKIVAFPTSFIWKMMNVSKVKTKGADFNVNTNINISEKFNISISGAYSYMDAKDKTDKSSNLWNHQIPYTPKHSGNTMLVFENPIINIGYSLIMSSVRYSSNLNIKQNKIPGYYDHSIWIERSFNLKEHKFSLRADAINITDKNYEVIRFYPMPGRSYRFTINYKY